MKYILNVKFVNIFFSFLKPQSKFFLSYWKAKLVKVIK